MDVKEAVKLAKATVTDLFAAEGLANLGLEEVEYDEEAERWHITVGFSRPWDHPSTNQLGAIAAALGGSAGKRTYKAVIIDKEGKTVSVKNRETADAG